MVDLHTHIMYGWDDGAESLEVSLEMARIAVGDGIRVMAATPHMWWAQERVDPDLVRKRVAEINAAVAAEGLDLRIVTGTEIPAWWEHLMPVKHKAVLRLADSRTILFEVPFNQVPVRFNELLFQIKMLGITPLMAHPERCGPFLDDPDLFDRLIDLDTPVQVTAGSLTGSFGERVMDLAWRIVSQERPIVIASDAHGTGKRRPVLSEARALLAESFGEEAADVMCRINPAALIEDKPARVAQLSRKPTRDEPKSLTARLRRAFGRS